MTAAMFRDDALPNSSNFPTTELLLDSIPSSQLNISNNLDDVWGSASSSPTSETRSNPINYTIKEPSDIPRLRSEHSTAGYREGLSTAKNTTIQEGFDEGYSLGAVIGLEIGVLLGKLEGIYNALKRSGIHREPETSTRILLETARRELQAAKVFGKEWWLEDGTWKYEIVGEDYNEAAEFTFKEVAKAHPLIKQWSQVVNKEVGKWSLDLDIVHGAEIQGLHGEDEG